MSQLTPPGENVSCVVVENVRAAAVAPLTCQVLYQDDRVHDAAAVSLPCEEWGERVGAVVVLKCVTRAGSV